MESVFFEHHNSAIFEATIGWVKKAVHSEPLLSDDEILQIQRFIDYPPAESGTAYWSIALKNRSTSAIIPVTSSSVKSPGLP